VLRRTALLFQDWLPAQSGKLNAYRLHCFSDTAAPFRGLAVFRVSARTEAQLSVQSDALAGLRLPFEDIPSET
jgi:hypothetical protein